MIEGGGEERKIRCYCCRLTQTNAESLFKKIESILLEYIDEIRNQVLKRSQTYLKASNDVQLFISYLLDEYNTFIQAAKNVSTILSYLVRDLPCLSHSHLSLF